VLLGTLVDFADLRKVILLASFCFAAILVSRGIVVQTGRLAWPTFSSLERELMLWFVPRGLITAVLGIEVLEARGKDFAFLPSLAFGVVLLSNLILLIGSVRARNLPRSAPISI
jgi:NhaP-type Na+/H+ and K+/H+ antiporter